MYDKKLVEKNINTWSIFWSEDYRQAWLVKTTDHDSAYDSVCKFMGVQLKYDLAFHDRLGYGSCWQELITEYDKDHIRDPDYNDQWIDSSCEKAGVGKNFDLLKIAQFYKSGNGFITILDDEGKEIVNNILNYSIKEKLLTSAKDIGDAGLMGIKLAGANKMNQIAFNRLKPLLQNYGINPEDQAVKAAIMLLLPVLLHPISSVLEDKVPHASYIKNAMEHSFTETVRENSSQLIEFASLLFEDMYKSTVTDFVGERININYDKYNVSRLKDIAKNKGIRIKSSDKRDKILSLIKEADAEEEQMTLETEPKSETLTV